MNIIHSKAAAPVWQAVHFGIMDSGWAKLDSQWNQSHPSPPYSRLYYILSGKGSARNSTQEMPLRPGHVYLLPIGVPLEHSCPQEMTQLYFHISAQAADGYDLFSRCPCFLELPMDAPMEELAEAFLSEQYLPLTQLKAQVEKDLHRFICAASLDEWLLKPHSAFLENVFSIVQKNLCSSLTIRQVAQQMAISESALSKRFRQEYGLPLGRYMNGILVQEICRLLASTDLSIGRIAEKLGFCDQFYLARFFSQHQGMSPRQYRAAIIQLP